MKWKVDGADRQTGKDVSVMIDAADQGMAQIEATYRGILVSSITPELPLPKLDYQDKSLHAPAVRTGGILKAISNANDHFLPALGGLIMFASWIAVLAMLGNGFSDLTSRSEFQTDNAIGATANLVRELKGAVLINAGLTASLLLITIMRLTSDRKRVADDRSAIAIMRRDGSS